MKGKKRFPGGRTSQKVVVQDARPHVRSMYLQNRQLEEEGFSVKHGVMSRMSLLRVIERIVIPGPATETLSEIFSRSPRCLEGGQLPAN